MNYLTYRLSLAKLNRQRETLHKHYAKLIEAAEKAREHDKARELDGEEYGEAQYIDEEVSLLVTRYLVSRANKRFLPIPEREPNNGFWDTAYTMPNRSLLTNKGITEIRSVIRKDMKERLDLLIPWVPAILGILGAVTGLIAVIKR